MFTNLLFCTLRPIFAAAMVVLLSMASPVIAEEADKNPAVYLTDYIQKVCKKDCVDGEVLLAAVNQAATELNLNQIALLALVETESGFRVHATNGNSGKSVGLTQVQVYWHKNKFHTKDHYDVFDNVRVGALIYKECVTRHKGSRDNALWCYNGHTKHGKQIYVPKVQKSYARLSKLPLLQ